MSEALISPIKRVMVVGGTHGNEYTGVWCIKSLEAQRTKWENRYPSLKLETLLANPTAHMLNKRFVDTDLNREFVVDKLCAIDEKTSTDRREETMIETVESIRARELDEILGSKCDDDHAAVDVAIDLHSTTSNMGTTIIIPEGDELMAQAAAYVSLKCPGSRCLMHSIPERMHRPNLSSAAKHGFTIEVGPVPVGVLRHDAVENTEAALHAILDFLQRVNMGEDIYGYLQDSFPDGWVPCFRTAPAVRPGEISGKIKWPSDSENPNFPALMVHKSLQDRDYHLVKKGDPLFVAQDGSVVHYEGSHGDEVYLIFINEAGYYYQSSGTGIGVAVESKFDLEFGMLFDFENVDELTYE